MATTMFVGLAQLRHIGVIGLAVTLTEAGAKGARGGTRHHVRRSLVVAADKWNKPLFSRIERRHEFHH